MEDDSFGKLGWISIAFVYVGVLVVLWCDWNVNVYSIDIVCACYVVVLQEGPGAHNT